MSRHHLISALLAGAALVITGAVFFGSRAAEKSEDAASPAPAKPAEPKVFEEEPCPSRLVTRAGTPAHQRTALCGRLWVPESEDGRRKIQVFVTHLPLKGAEKKRSPLLLIPGGPGDAFSHHLEMRLSTFGPLAKERDLLVIDQRGAGQSKPRLECSAKLKTREQLETCFRKWRADLDPSAYNTTESARDIARVLDQFEIDKVAIYSVSYGTRLAETFAGLYPDRVERMILDSPIPYDVDVLASAAKMAQEGMQRLLTACEDSEECRKTFGEVTMPRLLELVAKLEDGKSGSGDALLYDLSKLALHPGVLPYVPLLIQQAFQDDFALLAELRKGFSTYDSSLGLHLSVQCSEFFAHSSPAQIEAGEADVEPTFRRVFSAASYEQQCAGWSVEPRPRPAAPKNLEFPVLVVNGALDPVTPPAYGASVQKGYSTSRHVTIGSVAHGAVLSSCGALLGSAFLRGGLESALPVCHDQALSFETTPPDASRIAEILRQIRYRL